MKFVQRLLQIIVAKTLRAVLDGGFISHVILDSPGWRAGAGVGQAVSGNEQLCTLESDYFAV